MTTEIIGLIVLVAACFFAAVLCLAADTRLRARSMRVAAGAAIAVGCLMYGYGYAACQGLSLSSLFRALLALCRMFGGVNDLGSIQAAPLLQVPAVMAVFWMGHFLAFYVTASAAIATLGERLLRSIRVTLLRRGTLTLICGVNESSVDYGRSAVRAHRSVLYVDTACAAGLEGEIKAMGAVLDRRPDALNPTPGFLRRVGIRPGKRRVEVAALQPEGSANLLFAQAFAAAMRAAGIRPEQVSLLSCGIGEHAAELQAAGFGSVYDTDPYDLTARMTLRLHPPCGMIAFDGRSRAAEDFHAVILGFGRMGRAMLAQLILNAQFDGSRFRADVFDPGAQNGFLHDRELLKSYDIRFHTAAGFSDEFYSFLEEARDSVRCIALCTGSSRTNAEIADDLTEWFRQDERRPALLRVTRDEICDAHGRPQRVWALGAPDIWRMDAMAMQINQRYCKANGKTAEENWRECDYFSRMSCRASADFAPAMLRAAGKTEDEVLAGSWPPDEETLEHLSVTEHLRWCAFHRVMGYRRMSDAVYQARAERWQRETRELGTSSVRIGKDAERRLHACLIPWEELDALSARENAVTGGHVDYKDMDRENVLALRDILTAMRESKEGSSCPT